MNGFSRAEAVGRKVLQVFSGVTILLIAVNLFGWVRTVGAIPNIVTTKNDTLVVDANADNFAGPGDTIRYTTVVTNTEATSAVSVVFDDTIDANTTLVAGSLRTTPIARHDQYTSLGNVGITVPAGSGVLVNDDDPDGQSVSVIAAAGATANGGAFAIGADGAFSYLPPAGFEGADSFNYIVQDSDGNQDPAMVFILVTEVIWFIDNSATAGDGRLGSPFPSIAAFNSGAAGDLGDIVFLYSGTGSYTSGIALLNDQYLVGQGATASIAAIAGLTVPPFSNALPATGGSRPTITTTSGDGVMLGQNNTLRGFNVGNTAGVGISDNGGTVGTLMISEVAISGTGGGIEANHGGALAVTLDSLSASSSRDEGIDLENVNGSFAVTAATGTLSMSGVPAIVIDGNPSLNINSLGFQSVSSSNTIQGISIRDTTGSFTVTGSGTTDGSGGTISNITNRGASFINASNISLSNMTFSNAATANGASNCTSLANFGCNAAIHLDNANMVNLTNVDINTSAQQGINGLNVTDFDLVNSTITACGNEVNEGCLRMVNLEGTALISNSDLSFAAERVAQIENSSKTLNLTVSNSTFRDTQSSGFGADGLEVTHDGSSNATIDIVNSSFLRNRTNGLQVFSEGTSFVSLDVTGSTFDRGTGIGIGMDLAAANTATLHFNVIGNPLINSRGSNAVNVFSDDSATVHGRVNNNTIQAGGSTSSGFGIRAQANTNSTMTLDIDNNTISDIGFDAGIQILSRLGSGRLDATINNNNVTVDATNSLYDIWVQAQDSNTTCANVTNNTTSGNGIGAFRARTVDAASTVILQGSGATASAVWDNNGNTPTSSVSSSHNGTLTLGGTCNTVTHPTAGIIQNQLATDEPNATLSTAVVNSLIAAQYDLAAELQSAVAGFDLAAFEKQANELASQLVDGFVSIFTVRPAYASGETVNVTLGTLNAGQVVVIYFDVTIDDPQTPATNSQICNQGVVSGNNFFDVLTDDGSTAAVFDPTCTALVPGTIIIAKDQSPDGSSSFGFTSNIPNHNAFNVSGDSSATFNYVPPGSYTVAEDDPSASLFALTGLSCDDGDSAAPSTTDLGTRTAAVNLESGETVTCTFTNQILRFNLGDRVWYDQDQDGIQDPNEPGHNGVSVDLFDSASCSGTPIASTTSAAGPTGFGDGYYQFTDLLGGNYCLQFSNLPAGWSISPANQGGDDGKDSDSSSSGQIANISLIADDPDEDLGIYVPGSLGDSVVCVSTGEGLANIDVTLFEDFDGDGVADGAAIAITATDGNGFYQFTGLGVALAGDPNNLTQYIVRVDTNDPDLGICSVLLSPAEFNPLLDSDNPNDPDNDFRFEYVNQAPVANDDSYTVTEDTTLNVAAPGVLANDTDADGDSLTSVLDTTTSNGALTLNSDGSFSYTPGANYCGPDSFSYHANDGKTDSNVATVDITVKCVDDPPVVAVDTSYQTVQYSDYIVDVMVSATDVDSHPLSISDNAPSALYTSGGCTSDGMGGTVCIWTLSGQVLVSAATYDVTFTVSDDTNHVDAETQIEVKAEDASITFDDSNPVSVMVDSAGGSSSNFSLTFYVTETQPDQASGLAAPGDISKANVSVTLIPVGPGGTSPGNCTPSGVSGTGYGAVLIVSCTFDDVPVNTYTVDVTVHGGYYSGSGEDVLTVYDPSLGFTTGGGWFYWPDTDERTNFGFTMKYNKKGKNLQGSLLLMRHLPDGGKYRIKSNALDGLAIGVENTFGWASFTGKATYKEPSWLEPKGNYHFTAYVEDRGEPGVGDDRFWIEVRDKDGNVVAAISLSEPADDNGQAIQGGNIVVPH